MGLINLFDRLIEEHGSANITRDNLVFLRDQIKAVEQRNVEAGNRISDLEQQVRRLAEERDDYAGRLRECQQRIADEAKKEYRLDEREKGILRTFAEKKTNTLILDSRDHVVSSLFVHKLLSPVSWNGLHKGPVPMRLTPKGQRAVEKIIHAEN